MLEKRGKKKITTELKCRSHISCFLVTGHVLTAFYFLVVLLDIFGYFIVLPASENVCEG